VTVVRPVVAGGTAPAEVQEPDIDEGTDLDTETPWVAIVWNDPINLMSYVSYVFQKLFGYSQAEEARAQEKLDAERRKREEIAAREAEKAAAKQREEDERRRQAEEKAQAEEERRRQRAEAKAKRSGGLGRRFKQEQHDEYDMDADETPVEPIPDIVERLKFYSREPQPAQAPPDEPEDAAVEDQAPSSRTTDAD
jgi:ATP-dependent Clp protease adaptor protein ClpS